MSEINKLITCDDCGKKVSRNANSCPNCGNPEIKPNSKKEIVNNKIKIDKKGTWCPNCGDRDSYKSTDGGGCLLMGILFISIIGILLIPLLPKHWKCNSCGNEWK